MRTRAVFLLAALVAGVAGAPVSPARAAGGVVANTLSLPGTSGLIRVVAVAASKNGAYGTQHGDPNDVAQDPSRTVGDAEPPSPLGNGAPCTGVPEPADCFRTLIPNDAAANESATDGHAHYHAGDTTVLVNEVKLFRAGDTILIGSPSCNFPRVGMTCERYIPGFGMVREQPRGEVAAIAGGEPAPGAHGPGMIRLAHPLAFEHEPGEQVVKLPTVYPGQDWRVDVVNEVLFRGDPAPEAPLSIRATFVPPQGSRAPWDSSNRRPLAKSKDEPVIQQFVHGRDGVTSFFVPREITYHSTAGRTFDATSGDDWYTVEVVARDGDGRVVADGLLRFKPNPVAIATMWPNPARTTPGGAVVVTGAVRDAFAAATMSRRVEDLDVNMVLQKPRGTKSYKASSCYDTDPGPNDLCGGDVYGATPNMHGNFFVRISGSKCNGENLGICMRGQVTGDMADTQDTGTYTLRATLRGILPAATGSTSFVVEWPEPLDALI